MIVCFGFYGADLYKLWVLGEKTLFIIPNSIILGYFLVLWILKVLIGKMKQKLELSNI